MTLSRFENTYLEPLQQTPGLLDTYLEEHSDDFELVAESLAIDLMEDVVRLLQRKGISRSELADLMNVSKAYVTRLLNTPPNLTLMSVARLGVALNAKPYIGLAEQTPFILGTDTATISVAAGVSLPDEGDLFLSGSTSFPDEEDYTVLRLNAAAGVNIARPQIEPGTARPVVASTA